MSGKDYSVNLGVSDPQARSNLERLSTTKAPAPR